MRLPLSFFPFAAALVSAGYYRNTACRMKESIHSPPDGWRKDGPAPPEHVMELKIALPQPNFSILEKHLWEVSDPGHERYGAYLSKEEAEALMAPHPETLDAVNEWLSSHGIEEEHLSRSSAQDWVTVRVSVALAEEMLDTKYHIYTHSDSGESIVRTTSYGLPESLHEHIEAIQPTTMFTRIRPFKSKLHWSRGVLSDSTSLSTRTIIGPARNEVNASCRWEITIQCLKQIYNIEYNTSADNGNQIAVTAYLNQQANEMDLQQFFKLQNPGAYGSNYTFVSVNGGLNDQSYAAVGSEANLDTQFAFGLTYPTPATLYSTGGSPLFIPSDSSVTNTNEPYADWLDYVLSLKQPPQTISTSYGDEERTVPYSYAKHVCRGFAALGARGVSLLFSSGDSGVGGYDPYSMTSQYLSNDGTNRATFIPDFPPSCPYVTVVGGTTDVPETAASISGGGFSNYFARPSWQNESVSEYLQSLTPGTYQGLYNGTGRAYPDVAAQAKNFLIVLGGGQRHISGTSCSSPTFAAIVSMLNDARINANKPPLGFLNPWIYRTGYAGLNDITTGNNPGCGTDGFNATVGWDPVTGLGTPNFERLLQLAIAA